MTIRDGGVPSSAHYLETFFNRDSIKRFAFPGALVWGPDARGEVASILGEANEVDCYVDTHFASHPLTDELLFPISSRVRRRVVVAGEPRTQAVIADASAFSVPDAVIAIGGGSTIDFAKAVIATRIFGHVDDVGMGRFRGLAPLPGVSRPTLVAVPTTAGTGADASRYYVTYDGDTKSKVHGKSWRLIADWSVLDPAFLRGSPTGLLITSAFDTFVHLFESMICRGEASWFGHMLSLDTIPRLVRSLDAVASHGDRSDETLLELLFSASVGGISISNTRTGNIHEAAGALLEVSALSHPETLFVFFESAYEQYAEATTEICETLLGRLHVSAPDLDLNSMRDVIDWWGGLFRSAGATDRIRAQVEGLQSRHVEIRERIFERVWADRVWIDKESPVTLSRDEVRMFIDRGLALHGLADG